MKVGDYVEVMDAAGGGEWKWAGRKGHVTEADKYCLAVRTDDGEDIRDIREHFRPTFQTGAKERIETGERPR